jgi:predicted subunit of tRNA(5-methylaminomethyl-2-thiouridylate) methyltransferase
MKKEKIIVLLSGGLDSLVSVKLLHENYDITALYFKFPFSKDFEKEIKNFAKESKIKLKIFDCTKGKLLQDYLNMIRRPKYGYGTGINPCMDCRIFIFKKAKEFADKNKIKKIATGEVIGERPMSQTQKKLEIIEKESGLDGRLIRPLCDMGIRGRKRDKQMALAEKYKISYPTPSGGCLLCEKNLKNRLKILIHRDLNKDEIKLLTIGRHFFIDDCWIVLGRREKENDIIEKFKNSIMPEFVGPSAVVFGNYDNKMKSKVYELLKAYSSKNLKHRDKFEKYRL